MHCYFLPPSSNPSSDSSTSLTLSLNWACSFLTNPVINSVSSAFLLFHFFKQECFFSVLQSCPMEKILSAVENMQETPIKILIQSKPNNLDCITPSKEDQEMDKKSENSGKDLRKSGTPDPLKVPKAFKYPERYRSPTDLMISPITKGILARNKKGGALLPPSWNQPKVQDVEIQEVVPFKIEL